MSRVNLSGNLRLFDDNELEGLNSNILKIFSELVLVIIRFPSITNEQREEGLKTDQIHKYFLYIYFELEAF